MNLQNLYRVQFAGWSDSEQLSKLIFKKNNRNLSMRGTDPKIGIFVFKV